MRLSHRYTRATLETTVVDPGREYFFDLQRYTFNASNVFARVDLGARLWAEGEGAFAWNRFDDRAAAASSTTTTRRSGPAWATISAAI